MPLLSWARGHLQAQRGALFPWIAVCYGIGIGIYFALRFEPGLYVAVTLIGVLLGMVALARWHAGTARAMILTALVVSGAGFLTAQWRANGVAEPVLGFRYYGPVEGRIIGLDRSASGALRLTLDHIRLEDVAPHKTPARVRISLHGDATTFTHAPKPGAFVMTTAHISPPAGPVEPGGFDFQRHSWFLKLGGVGYTRVPVLTYAPARWNSFRVLIFRWRMAVSEAVREALPGDVGGFAAAVTSGDRSGMSQEAIEDLRASNLAHLLAISGLHMGLLTAFVFASLRIGLALIPGLALRLSTKKLAAIGALLAGAAYLALSGGNVATERAFIMAAVALCAILADRRALTIRSVAIAALIVLAMRPEAILGPGFQMSFAATTALVAVFGWIRDMNWRAPRWLQPISSVVLSSLIAGLATAPIAAAHFNAMAHYGLLANLLSVPVMGILVVPAAVIAACLSLIGIEEIGLWAMGLGLRWILAVGAYVSELPGARSFIVGPGPWVLPLLCLGALFAIIWQGRGRLLGVIPILGAMTIWSETTRPDILIADNGALIGVMTPDGRALSKAKGAGFIGTNWLENDGDAADQPDAHTRWLTHHSVPNRGEATALLNGQPFTHLSGKRAITAAVACRSGLVVVNQDPPAALKTCGYLSPTSLKPTGAIALRFDGTAWHRTTSRDVTGDRLWTQWPKPENRHQ